MLPVFWLLANLFTIVALGFYSMMEMACVSFNKVRLQYYVSKKKRRAIWLNELLKNPSKLFGTTLIGVNVAMMLGSECAREFHTSIGVSPDLAPLTQVMIVIIFGELAPMFAARRYSEHVALLGTPLLFFSSKLLAPFLWSMHAITWLVSKLFRKQKTDTDLFLSQEELLKALEEHPAETEDINKVITNIFALKNKLAKDVMEPLSSVAKLSSNATIAAVQKLLKRSALQFIPVYHDLDSNIVAIASPRDLVRIPNTKRIRDYANPPWFITLNTRISAILQQFRHNNQSVAIVLDNSGNAVGIISLDDLIEEIFGEVPASVLTPPENLLKATRFVDRTFSGETTVDMLEKELDVKLDENKEKTLSQLIAQALGHHPDVGDTLYLPPFEVTVKEISLLEVKKATFTTHL